MHRKELGINSHKHTAADACGIGWNFFIDVYHIHISIVFSAVGRVASIHKDCPNKLAQALLRDSSDLSISAHNLSKTTCDSGAGEAEAVRECILEAEVARTSRRV
jgi:hypothetical protein